MEIKNIHFYRLNNAKYRYTALYYILAITMGLLPNTSIGANVVSRVSVARPSAASSRMPTINTRVLSDTTTPESDTTASDSETTSDTEPLVLTEPELEYIAAPAPITDKSGDFGLFLNSADTSGGASEDELAEMVRRQRAALDTQDVNVTIQTALSNAIAANISTCDTGLRECMKKSCGNDFVKCGNDSDTAWGRKLDACRRNVKCTGEEYRLFGAEIKADRDVNVRLALYNEIVNCGTEYNACIISQCGEKYSKCLGRNAESAAISACSKIANNCKNRDNGLASRTRNVLSTLRQGAEVQVKKDEQQLYTMRDEMRNLCKSISAMFDERTFDCVYTVEFFAGGTATPYASKKAYAGSTFDCTPDWFGIDVTTFKENAYRLTRSAKSASSALLGAGIGVGVGALTSGAIDRAMNTHKAEQALEDAEKIGKPCREKNATTATYAQNASGKVYCQVQECENGYSPNEDHTKCKKSQNHNQNANSRGGDKASSNKNNRKTDKNDKQSEPKTKSKGNSSDIIPVIPGINRNQLSEGIITNILDANNKISTQKINRQEKTNSYSSGNSIYNNDYSKTGNSEPDEEIDYSQKF